MNKTLFLLLPFVLCANAAAFELPGIHAAQIDEAFPAVRVAPPSPAPYNQTLKAASSFSVYAVNGVDVAVPYIGGGQNVLAVLRSGETAETLSAKLRPAFGAAAGARAAAVQPQSQAELELAAKNPGAVIVTLNPLFPAGVAALFNREPGFAGPNCFNAAFVAGGLLNAAKLRHVGNPEADQLLSMYYKKTPSVRPQPGDVLVLNDGDHSVYYLGGGLIFHKKSYLKQHIYRIVQLEKAYEPEPNEWKPGPFDDVGSIGSPETIRKTEAWRPSGAHYDFGQATADERAKAELVIFIADNVTAQAPAWHLAQELGYFTELLLDSLVSDWKAMADSPNPVLRAYYHQLESLRDQANQSIELELLSSPYSQSNADEILKRAWLPRNNYSREAVGRLLKIYGRDQGQAEQALDAIGKDYNKDPLPHLK